MANKLGIKKIKEELLKLGIEQKEIDTLDNDAARELFESKVAENILENAVEEDEAATIEEPKEKKPSPTDRDWTKYVISLFDKDELQDGMPKVDGLRRVAQLLYGQFNIYSDVLQYPTLDNSCRATVKVRLDFTDINMTVEASADVFSGNTDREYAKHPVATAETRAEGRALRKALKLVKVLSAEELYGADKDEPDGIDKRITQGMLNSLNIMCENKKVDLLKLALTMDFKINSIEDLTHKQGLEVSNKLGRFQRKEEEIPDNVKK